MRRADIKMNSTKGHIIGTAMGVEFEVHTWSPSDALVDLSIACMFSSEYPGTTISGGLLHLNAAMGDVLTQLRSAGIFRAMPMESLLIASPPAAILAKQVLIMGLGDPSDLRGDLLFQAAAAGMAEAIRLNAGTVAFAPSLLDSGHSDNGALDAPASMLRGALQGLRLQSRLSRHGLSSFDAPRRWTFDAGTSTFERAFAEFTHSFDAIADASTT